MNRRREGKRAPKVAMHYQTDLRTIWNNMRDVTFYWAITAFGETYKLTNLIQSEHQ